MNTPLDRIGAFFTELRRRRVIRTAGLYLVGAWVAIEVTSTVFPLLFLPEWTSRAVVVLAILGVPVVLVGSWAFDLTSEGLERASDHGASTPLAARVGMVALTVLATAATGWVTRDLWLTPPVEASGPLDPSRVAVLYFDDYSEGGQLGFLANGLTESLIHELAQIRTLKVVSRNGVKPFRENPPLLDSIARALGAGMLVEGSVEGGQDRLNATVQLIDGRTGDHMMSERIEARGDDILALRDSVVSEAARQVGQAMGRSLDVQRRRSGTDDPVAWRQVQEARGLIERSDTLQWSLGDTETARAALLLADSLLADAAERDDDWAEPVVMRGEVAGILARLGGPGVRSNQDGELLRIGIGYADEALARDPGTSAALALRGSLRKQLSWQDAGAADALLRQAESDFKAAVAVNPDEAHAWVGLADLYRSRGDFAEAAVAAERALDADPFLIHAEQLILFTLGHIWLELEQFDRALQWAEAGQKRYPAVPAFDAEELVILAGSAGVDADPDSAWAHVRAVEEAYGMDVWPHGHLQVAAVLARNDRPDSARAIVGRMRQQYEADPWLDYYEANVMLQLGDRDWALDLLGQFLDQLPHRRSYIARDWWWRPLRDDPRFRELVAGP